MTKVTNDGLRAIFRISKKRDLQKHFRDLTVTRDELFSLIVEVGSGQRRPFGYRRHFREVVPEHVDLSQIDSLQIGNVETAEEKAAFAKLDRLFTGHFEQRKQLIGHMFQTDDQSKWHFIYFDQRDLKQQLNHWTHGAHIHLINYLWPNWTAETLWNEFVSGAKRLSGALHVRFDIGHYDEA